METLILTALGIMALAIVFIRSRKTIKGFSQDHECDNCPGCSNCCSLICDHKKD